MYDNGSSTRVIPATVGHCPSWRTSSLDLPIPKKPVPRLVLHGQEVRSGLLRARVVGMYQTELCSPATSSATRTSRRPASGGISWDSPV